MSQNVFPVRPLGSTGITPLPRLLREPVRLPTGAAEGYVFPAAVGLRPLRPGLPVPRSIFGTRRPLSPRRARRLQMPVASPTVAGFANPGRLATLTSLTRPIQVRLRYGSRFCLTRLRRIGLPRPRSIGYLLNGQFTSSSTQAISGQGNVMRHPSDLKLCLYL